MPPLAKRFGDGPMPNLFYDFQIIYAMLSFCFIAENAFQYQQLLTFFNNNYSLLVMKND
jgi:hypothetical protein